MTEYEQIMCEMQADFFELSVERLNCSSRFFISRFMKSDIVKQLDDVDDPYNFVSPNNLITSMIMDYPSINNQIGEKYPPKVMRWIGYTYRAWSLIKKKKSNRIYELMKAEEMASLYNSFHTFSVEYCIDRLEDIVSEKKSLHRSDYEIFKAIMLEQKQ